MWILRSSGPQESGRAGRTFRISAGNPRTIGRSAMADFRVDVAMVSRVHCRFTVAFDGQLEIEDLSSTNGTFVNNARVGRAALAAGDRVRIGKLEMVVVRGH